VAAAKEKTPWSLEKDLLLYGQSWLVVSDKRNLQTQLLNKMYCQASTAHPERNKMRKLLAERYYWPDITQNIN